MDGLLKKLPRVGACCCCIPLDIGTLIIGYIEFIGGILVLIGNCVLLKDLNGAGKSTIGSMVFDIILQGLIILIALFLIMGVHKKIPRYVFVWLSATICWMILKIISGVVFLCFLQFAEVIGVLIYCVIQFYLIVVVNTVYQDYENGGDVNF